MEEVTGYNPYSGKFSFVITDRDGEPEACFRVPASVVLEEVEKHLRVELSLEGGAALWKVWAAGEILNVDSCDVMSFSRIVARDVRKKEYQDEEMYYEHLALLANELRECTRIVYEQRKKAGFISQLALAVEGVEDEH